MLGFEWGIADDGFLALVVPKQENFIATRAALKNAYSYTLPAPMSRKHRYPTDSS
jgi:hypothetical protein